MENSPWHAIYAKSNCEKKLCEELLRCGVECYLPLNKELRKWSDRKKWIEKPLIPSYVFVRGSRKEMHLAIGLTYAVCFVTFGGRLANIPNNQIETLKLFLKDCSRNTEMVYEQVKKGEWVRVKYGPMKGIVGEVVEMRGRQRIVLRFASPATCILTDISMDEVERIRQNELAGG
ncbi:UpxY family transcription antiterminator [Labilibaculum sp.]|uniref:UpxY family transcription antiterminator n=1 Tax=Labilibaculum sp. TaxID=2060723 RepID=UPI0035631AE9